MGNEDLNPIERIVFKEIDKHRGRGEAVRVPTLTKLVNLYLNGESLSELQVRQVVRRLILDYGILIGSATRPPPGYYIITDSKEVNKVVSSLTKRGLKILKRAAKIKNIGLKEFIGQLRLGI